MTPEIAQQLGVANPKLTLFAFQLCRELTQAVTSDANQLWEHLAEVGKKLNLDALEQLPQALEPYLLTPPTRQTGPQAPMQPLLRKLNYPANVLDFSVPDWQGTGLRLEGALYPLLVHDTYSADLTLILEGANVSLEQLCALNPKGLLRPEHLQPSLGQVFVLFAKPANPTTNLRKLADDCLQSLLPPDEDWPFILQQGRFLGGNLLFYETAHDYPSDRLQMLVWFATDPKTDTLEGEGHYYYPLLKLFLCRNKILLAYAEARCQFEAAKEAYRWLEQKVADFGTFRKDQNQALRTSLQKRATQVQPRLQGQLQRMIGEEGEEDVRGQIQKFLHQETRDDQIEEILGDCLKQDQEQRLSTLESWLLEAPQEALAFTRSLRNIDTQITTIELTTENYQQELQTLKQLSLPEDDLGFLMQFQLDEFQKLLKQIRYDQRYLTAGKVLFEQMINSIRGLVEIDAQKQELLNDLAEKERDRRLQSWFTVVGSGLALSGLSATIQTKPVQAIVQHFHPKTYQSWPGAAVAYVPLNILFHVTVGFTIALLARGIIERLVRIVSANKS